jgi:chloramphenicol 3-O phosphotransferase
MPQAGQIVILNGTPRSGKSSISHAIQEIFNGVWLNLGVDRYKETIPERYQPGIGLRPGGERPDLEPLIVTMYDGLYEAIAAQSRLGLNVVVDVGHHDNYSQPRGILARCARRLAQLPALFVGVRCPIEVVMERRIATWQNSYAADGSIPPEVHRWQDAVHTPGIYDVEVDTSKLSSAECAAAIRQRLDDGVAPTALRQLAAP